MKMMYFTFVLVLFLTYKASVSVSAEQKECIPRSYGFNSIVCVCNATYCDTIPRPSQVPKGQYVSYTSTLSGLRFKMEQGEFQPISHTSANYTIININPQQRYQRILGWGGAFSDATGININSLSCEASDNLLRSYFSEDGLEYSMCRVPMGGTDFSLRVYTYDDGDPDPELKNFKLAPEDYNYKIPLIKKAYNLTNGNLDLFTSTWTSPIWMKHNGKYSGPDILRPDMYQVWANYFLKFLQAYKDEGINFWGITTGNEPTMGLTPVNSTTLGWLPWQMGTWIAKNLGLTLRNSDVSSIKLLAIDDQLYMYPWWINAMFKNQKDKKYIDGFALHWYANDLFPRSLLRKTQNEYPDKFILSTEACQGFIFHDVKLGDWNRGENYANDIIKDLNHWVAGWVDWNMALDITGGPTFVKNYVDSPIIVNAESGEFYKQPMFYALGHFSKFVPKGSIRISTVKSDNKLKLVTLQRPDNGIVVIIMNKRKTQVPVKVRDASHMEITRVIPARSIVTILYW